MATNNDKRDTQTKQSDNIANRDDNQKSSQSIKSSPTEPVAWWNRTGLIALFTALLAATAPLTTGIKGCYELRVQQEKNRFDMRDKYLERAIDKRLGAEERERLFEFLVAVFKDDPLQLWAEAQLNDATAELKKKIEKAEEERDKVEQALEKKQQESEVLELDIEKHKRQISNLKVDLAAAERYNKQPEVMQSEEFVDLPSHFEVIYSNYRSAVVRVESGPNILSGFFISKDGKILTANAFSIPEIGKIRITTEKGETFDATLKEKSDQGLALLKTNYHPPTYFELSTSIPPVAAQVLTIGFLEGKKLFPTFGKVIFVTDEVIIYGRNNIRRMPGTAGGPLININGKIIGLHNTAWNDGNVLKAEGISIAQINKFIKSVKKKERNRSVGGSRSRTGRRSRVR